MMRDYSELIDSLRELAEDVNDEASRAADAIEELLAERDDWETIAKYKAKIIEKMESEQRDIMRQLPTWISVEERLPHYLDHVLCVNKYGIQIVGHLTDYKEGGFRCESGMDSCDYITHWMYLPEAPKEEA